MKNRSLLSWSLSALVLGLLAQPATVQAAAIDQSTITQVVKQVNVIEAASKRQKPARTNEVFRVPDVMRTGADSRAEMVAPDRTVTRVGANSVFSFSPEKREVNLERGSVLFSSPTGKGGGTIKTAAATASVLGTTIIVVATKNGGFKVLVLEGRAFARLPNGRTRTINAGQLTFVLPGSTQFGPVVNYRLGDQTGQSKLVKGFRRPLDSMEKINLAVARQESMIAAGQIAVTNLEVRGDEIGNPDVRQTQTENIEGANGLARAFTSDAIISTSKLERQRLFRVGVPAEIQSAIGASLVGNFSVFAARNITVATPFVDLTEFEGESLFAFLAFGDFISQQSTRFSGLSATSLFFVVGGAFTATGDFSAASQNGANFLTGFVNSLPFTLTDAFLINPTGDVNISAPSFVSTNSDVHAPVGNIDISTRSGDITIDSSARTGNFYSAGQGTSTHFPSQHGSSSIGSISLSAANDLSINRVDFAARDVSLSARTVTLSNVAFQGGSSVTLSSANGRLSPNPNTGQPATPGNVNFVRNVTYGGAPAQQAVNGGSIVIQKR